MTAKDGIVNLRVVARAPPWVDVKSAELWVNGERIAETERTAARPEINRVQWRERVVLPRDSWIVVVARGAVDLEESYPGGRGLPFAIANPIFVDVDGDGEFTARLAADDAPANTGAPLGAAETRTPDAKEPPNSAERANEPVTD
jgi:hypothetical protein